VSRRELGRVHGGPTRTGVDPAGLVRDSLQPFAVKCLTDFGRGTARNDLSNPLLV